MGQYLNPRNDLYLELSNSEIYVDKTGLLSLLNKKICTIHKYICSSRPRRFGKSLAIDMMVSYYSRGCDSRALFKDSVVSNDEKFDFHLNKYDVIKIDMLVMCGRVDSPEYITKYVTEQIGHELKCEYPNCICNDSVGLEKMLLDISLATGKKFIILIDEWDAIFRLYSDNYDVQKEYIDFLRSIFKGSSADQYVALAYITGILPIKKYGTQSALNNFDEFTMTAPDFFAEYIGFTENEVLDLCKKNNIDFDTIKDWYDGYILNNMHIYNPKSVIEVCTRKVFRNYWTSTEAFENLVHYINMNFDGLKNDIVKMLAGEHIPVNIRRFKNDMVTFTSKNDVLTLLIHFGYLAYDESKGEVYIPNTEIKDEFDNSVQEAGWSGVATALEESRMLLNNTLNKNSEEVASALEKIHDENVSLLKYNDENSLSLVITLAYYCTKDEYIIIRELPAGKGYADVVFVPKKNSNKPAIIVELKYNKDAVTALEQIKQRQYISALEGYKGTVLLVGINYNKDIKDGNYKHHECIIEEINI